MILPFLFLTLDQPVTSTPALGTEAARCRLGEVGPAVMIEVAGLKDRAGLLRAELYPDNDRDFLADDNVLVAKHKTFRRVDAILAPTGPIRLCLRVPVPGRYTMALLHDRNGDRRFEPLEDGIGFPGNPRLGWSRPRAAEASLTIGPGVTTIAIVMNYRHGLLAFGPLTTIAEAAIR